MDKVHWSFARYVSLLLFMLSQFVFSSLIRFSCLIFLFSFHFELTLFGADLDMCLKMCARTYVCEISIYSFRSEQILKRRLTKYGLVVVIHIRALRPANTQDPKPNKKEKTATTTTALICVKLVISFQRPCIG